jgi:hypothetical protein
MDKRLVLVACMVVSAFVAACSSSVAWPIERQGERCQDLELLPGKDGRIRVEDVSFVPLEDFRATRCFDESGWIWVHFGDRDGEQEHTVATHFGLLQLDAPTAELVTPENRRTMLWAIASECVSINRADPRCRKLEATPNDFSIPGLDCVGWDETWLDLGVPGAEGEEWPTQARSALCFDRGEPPAAVVMMAWSEQHHPDIGALAGGQAEQQSREFISSLKFETE